MVGYVEKIILDSSGLSLLSNKLHNDKSGNNFEKFFLACLTRTVLSAKNKTFLIQLFLLKTSTTDIAVLVFPVPVPITKRNFRFLFSKSSHRDVIASF